MNITPDHITKLAPNEVFVYGANRGGRHGRGAAKDALKWGAVYGCYGLAGQTYGICTKDNYLNPLSLDEIKIEVDRFVRFVGVNPQLTFLVTPIGTGLAGFKPKEIAPMFNVAGLCRNVYLPFSFWEVLNA